MRERGDLYPYQNRVVEFIKSHENCAIWVDPGLGKTVSTLTAFADLRDAFDAERMLVVAPLRVARRVWHAEVQDWAHLQGLTVSRIVGTEKQRLAAMAQPAHIHTINRENVQWLENYIAPNRKQVRPWPWDLVTLDESQSFKSQSSQRWKSLRRLRKLFPRCVELTGTAAPNGYGDLWSQMFLLDRGARLGQTETAYRDRWFNPPEFGGFTWTIKEHAKAEIQQAVADITLVMRAEDYLDLPPVQYNRISVPLSPAIMKKYRALSREYILELGSGKLVTAVNAGVCRSKLLQLANGAIYVDERKYEVLHDEKLEALAEVLEGLPRPALIAYAFRHDRERLARFMGKFCGSHARFAFLDNDRAFDLFAAGQLDYGIAHPGSMGHGLNDLYRSGAEHAVWFGLTDNLEYYLQFNARLTGGHRRRGKAIVIHHILCDDTQDEETYSLITRKGATQDDLTSSLVRLARETT
ncbi:MAG TPA: DEAD/DEAH box helicase [Steroidobacteraceae bacterium]|nr:DEAD/DEAH box helicase [Steroidobacteraceae bacterium]